MAQAAASLGSVAALGRGFNQLDIARKFGLLVGMAVVVAIAAVLFMYGRSADYRVLFSNVNDRDGGAIVTALSQMNVPYRMADGGGAILVPDSLVYETRLKLAAQGLPKGGGVGFELMENQKFGTSQFVEQVNYQRALEGELARSVQSIGAVQAARVHLAIPRPSVFVRENLRPSASVMVQMYPGRSLDAGQVAGIVHLVSSSVPELVPGQVTVVDQSGTLLSSPSGAGSDGAARGLDASQLKYVHGVEAAIASRIETILRPITGPENVRAQVAASLDFSESEQTSETFKPNTDPKEQSVRSQQVAETSTPTPAAPAPVGVPGALSNTPPGAGTAPIVAATPPQAARPGQNAPLGGAAVATIVTPPPPPATTKDQTINYEVDKTIKHVKGETGAIRRLSVAVVVNYRRTTDSAGKVRQEPLSDKEIAQVGDLVREAMGFDKARGDSLNVVNAPFQLDAETLDAASPWKSAIGDLTTPSSVASIGKWVVVVGLILLIVFAVIRPILRDLVQAGRPQPQLPPMSAPLPEPGQPLGTVMINGIAVPVNEAVGGTYGKAGMEAAEVAYEADLRAVRDIAQQDPRIVAQVVKDWVGRDE